MSFRRSFIRLAERTDVHPALKKAWKKHFDVNGQVTQHLSPLEQKIVSPMFRDFHVKFFKKLKDFLLEAGPGLAIGAFIYSWGNAEHKRIAYHHRN